MSSVRILHVSDLHISRKEKRISFVDNLEARSYLGAVTSKAFVSTYDKAILFSLVDYVYDSYTKSYGQQSCEPLDVVLMTGDLATTGLSQDLALALKLVDGPEGTNKPLLTADGLPTFARMNQLPIWLLPGNHDRFMRAKVSGYSPGGKLFYQVFNNHWPDEVKRYPVIQRGNLYVSVIAADFSLRSKEHREGKRVNKYGQGKVYEDILNSLVSHSRQAIKDVASVDGTLALIWAIHYPPAFPNVSEPMRLIDDDALVRDANDCGVAAILAGHTHQPVRYRRPGMNFEVLCAGTSTQMYAPEGNFIHLITVSDSGSGPTRIESKNFRYESTKGFVPF